MRLRIIRVEGPDDNKEGVEKIFLNAQAGINLNDYLLYDTTFTDDDKQSNKGRHIYRFPNFEIDETHNIVLWIAKGPRLGTKLLADKTKGHRFYWGRTGPIINNTGDNLTLVRIAAEQLFEVAPE